MLINPYPSPRLNRPCIQPPKRCKQPFADVSVSAIRVFMLGLLAILSACHRAPPLAPELAAIRCPKDQAAHASTLFGKAELTFVCISKQRAFNPTMLRCDLTSSPMICEDAGTFVFTRSTGGTAYSGLAPDPAMPDVTPTLASPYRSRLIVNFRNGPPKLPTFDAVETDGRFLLAGSAELLPPAFTFVKGALCDRESSVLQTGTCNLEAQSASLYWHITVEIPVLQGTPVSAAQYRDEYAFWLQQLQRMVVDPSPKQK